MNLKEKSLSIEKNTALAEDMLDPAEVDWIGIADLLADTAREVEGE